MSEDSHMSQSHPVVPPAKSLSQALMHRVVLLSLIGIVGLGATIALGLLITLDQVQSRMDRINVEAVSAFDRFILDIQCDLLAAGEGLASRKDRDAALLALRTRNRAFLDVLYLSPEGTVLARRSAYGRPPPANFANPAWLASPPAFGRVVIGPVHLEGQTPCVDMAVMVTDDISLPAGLLLVRVDLTELWNTTLDVKVGETGYAFIADSTGQLVAFRNRRLLETGSNLASLVGRTPQSIVKSRLSLYTGLNGEKDLASAQPLKTVPWFAVVEQPVWEALAPFLIPALLLLTALVTVGLLLRSTVRFTQIRIVSPLLSLRDAVGKMADGQMQQSVEVRSHDELGQLSDSFNRMAGRLRQAFADLEGQIEALWQAQATLRANEAKQGAMIANIADVIAIVDQNGMIKFKSPNIEKWFGWQPGDLLEVSAWDNIHPGDLEFVQHGLGAILSAANATQTGECRYRCKDGGYKWIELTATNLLENPNIAGILLNYHDITERKQAEAIQRESATRFQRLLEMAPLPLGYVKQDGVISFRNRRFVELFGYTAEEVPAIADWWLRAYPDPQYRQWVVQVWDAAVRQAAAEGRDIDPIEYKVTCKNGVVRDVEISGIMVGEDILAAFIDLTERKRAEESQARLATVVEQTAETIVITDTQGTIIYVNPAFEKTTGYSGAEVIGQNPRLLRSGRHDAQFYAHMWDVLQRGEVWSGRFVNRRKDGALFEEDATISPVRDAAGKVTSYVALKHDVTREVQLETQFRQSQKLEAIGQLAGGVAHDFNNILTAQSLQISMLEMDPNLSGDIREGLGLIRLAANSAAELTRQLLLFSRRQVMQRRQLDLNEVVMNLAKMLKRIIGEDVRLQLDLHSTPLPVLADAGMLEQVLMNLAVNARDAMPAGGNLRIETTDQVVDEPLANLYPDAAPGRYVCLSVSDTGGGIPPEIVPRIFEPFFTTKEAGKGTGLGLATVFGIIKQHRGWIKLDNRPGQGVTFQVFLPASTEPASELVPVAGKPTPRGGAETILLVEDEPAVRKSTCLLLERYGYRVLEASHGSDAINLWQNHRGTVAVLLTDLVMPGGMSGQQLAGRLRAEAPRLKVIFASGYSAEIAGRELQLREGEVFIQKPFAPEQLLETIRRSLDGGE
jgi:PAS domain S-box-containing protein